MIELVDNIKRVYKYTPIVQEGRSVSMTMKNMEDIKKDPHETFRD